MSTTDFFRARLDAMIDLRHPLAVLASRLPWTQIEANLAPVFAHADRAGRLDDDALQPQAQAQQWQAAVAGVADGTDLAGERDAIASRNSPGVGRGSSRSGRSTSSLSLMMIACFGSNKSAAAMRPTSRTKDENCLARACSLI